MNYDEAFYDISDKTTKRAAETILPYVIEWINPRSIIDFGCGEGMWLSIVKKIDPSIDIYGVDGEYISVDELKIDRQYFLPADLTNTLDLRKRFDLAISLEVGEHISKEYADVFIDNITRHADRVLYSAAIPGQGGVHHVNEKWQSYWIKKFTSRGYYVDYSLRNYFWECEAITPWRRQNILFFSKYKEDFEKKEMKNNFISDVVHPEMYLNKCTESTRILDAKKIYCAIDQAIKKLVKRNVHQIFIYPYGNHGFLCKEILNNKYHINEGAILDNKLCLTNPNIFPCEYLKNMKEDFYVLENSWDKNIRAELLKELRKYVPDEKIVSIFENFL